MSATAQFASPRIMKAYESQNSVVHREQRIWSPPVVNSCEISLRQNHRCLVCEGRLGVKISLPWNSGFGGYGPVIAPLYGVQVRGILLRDPVENGIFKVHPWSYFAPA